MSAASVLAPCPVHSKPLRSLHRLDARRAVRAAHPDAAEHLDGLSFDLPGGATLRCTEAGAWLLVDGEASIQLRPLPQLGVALRDRLVVMPGAVILVLQELATGGEPVEEQQLRGEWWARWLVTAERLGLIERAAPTSWRLTSRGAETVHAVDAERFTAVLAL